MMGTAGHHRVVCPSCSTVMAQCRCIGPKITITSNVACSKCQAKEGVRMPMGSLPPARRVMLAALYDRDLLELLAGSSKLRVRYKLPDDVRVLSVNADWVRNRILVLLYSESFEPVPEGAIPREMEPVQVLA